MKDKLYRKIGQRLRKFAIINFGSVSELERQMGKSINSLNSYVQGYKKPGAKLKIELEQFGCDINWLMTGKENENINNEEKKIIGLRLKEFANEKFGSVSELSRILGYNENSLASYIYGRAVPGTKLLKKLRMLGCNTHYLLTGQKYEEEVLLFNINSNLERLNQNIEKIIEYLIENNNEAEK